MPIPFPNLNEMFQVPVNPFVQADSQINAAAEQRAKAMMAQIEAQYAEQMQQANLEKIMADIYHSRVSSDAYAEQVRLQGQGKSKSETQKSVAEAEAAKRAMIYPALIAINEIKTKDPAKAATLYENMKSRGLVPEDLLSMESKQPSTYETVSPINPNAPAQRVESGLDWEALGSYMQNAERSKGIFKQQESEDDNAAKAKIAEIRAKAAQIAAATRAGAAPKESMQNYLVAEIRAKNITRDEAVQIMNDMREVSVLAQPGQQKPTLTDDALNGVPGAKLFTTPMKQYQENKRTKPAAGTNLTPPPGWRVE